VIGATVGAVLGVLASGAVLSPAVVWGVLVHPVRASRRTAAVAA